MSGSLVFDVETHDASLLYSMPPEEFVRLIGYKFVGEDRVRITTDLEELRSVIRSADWIIGHNIHNFDLRAVFGIDSDEPLELTDAGRVYDTWTHAVLVNPAPRQYINRNGKNALAGKPEQMMKWYRLDEQAHQLGVAGKTDDLKVLAKEFGGYGEIPIDEPRYVKYLEGDVIASEQVAKALLDLGPLNDYAMREQRIAARIAVISSNGFRVDQQAAQARVDELKARRDVILADIQERYDFPTEGKAPWASNAGKEAIWKALADHEIDTDNGWPRTKGGAKSLSGEALIENTKGTSAEELGQALAELKGQRSLAQLALDSMHPDGFAHPEITMLQRSGRSSTTKPGLTIWTARGEGAVEKSYFLADNDDELLVEIDYSNCDARIVAALSGDRQFAKRFEPDADSHTMSAVAAWGQETVDTDPAGYRQRAKILGHGWSYGGQYRTLSKQTGVPLDAAKDFCDGMAAAYPVLMAWQNRVRAGANESGFVVNDWGRRMPVEKGREFTQAPALMGQSGTREIVCDALLRMPYHVLRRIKAWIHDALLASVPRRNWEDCRDYLIDIMQTSFKPKRGGQLIDFPVEAGTAGDNWYAASH